MTGPLGPEVMERELFNAFQELLLVRKDSAVQMVVFAQVFISQNDTVATLSDEPAREHAKNKATAGFDEPIHLKEKYFYPYSLQRAKSRCHGME